MSREEFLIWVQTRHEELAEFVEEATRYRAGRSWPGSENNPTNQLYDRFLPGATDLLAALEEMRVTAEAAAQEGQNNP